MRNFKIALEFDGTDFHGWQRQPGLRTVQGVIEEGIAAVFRKQVVVNGAGRTDAGVHAFGQAGSFALDTELTESQIWKALSSKMPEDVSIRGIEEKDPSFHARFSAISRRYTYFVRTEPTAIWRRYTHVVNYPLDSDSMQQAVQYLIGERDFASFTPARSQDAPTSCNLMEAGVTDEDELIAFSFEADHFLHHMVRIIVGTLIEVGRSRIRPEQIKTILCKKDRTAAGPTAPPSGLFLMGVGYPDEFDLDS
jgi:tRNA pseudouridine38-40 synthase